MSFIKALFIWSRVPETTLPPSYPGRANFSLISLKNSTDCLHENANSSRGEGGVGVLRATAYHVFVLLSRGQRIEEC